MEHAAHDMPKVVRRVLVRESECDLRARAGRLEGCLAVNAPARDLHFLRHFDGGVTASFAERVKPHTKASP